MAKMILTLAMKINAVGRGLGGSAPPAGAALAFNYDLSSGSQFNLLWGGI